MPKVSFVRDKPLPPLEERQAARAREAQEAMREYETKQMAIAENRERLRSARLAKEAETKEKK